MCVRPISRVFVNRSLAMEKIKCFGFDMDYTLAGKFTNKLAGYFAVWKPIFSIFTDCCSNQSCAGHLFSEMHFSVYSSFSCMLHLTSCYLSVFLPQTLCFTFRPLAKCGCKCQTLCHQMST